MKLDEIFVSAGPFGLFVLSFFEASIFPVPPDVVLIPLCLANPKNALWYGVTAAFASVLGALFGYWIGLKGGRPLLMRLGDNRINRVEFYFNKYGVWAVGIAAFTPVPFKIFTIASGIFGVKDIRGFILASTIGRAGRFIPEAILLMFYGRTILDFIKEYFEVFTLVLAFTLVAGCFLYRRVHQQRRAA